MSQVNMDGLPPEMQARIAQIIEGAKQKQAAPAQPGQAIGAEHYQQQAAPVAKQPSLMDHMIALRQEVQAMRNELYAVGQVAEACGNATGALYSMFQEQTQPTDFSSAFQAQEQMTEDY